MQTAPRPRASVALPLACPTIFTMKRLWISMEIFVAPMDSGRLGQLPLRRSAPSSRVKGTQFLRELSLYFGIAFLEEPGTWIRRSVAGEMLSLRHLVTIESVRNATSSDEHVQSVPGKHFAELMQPKKRRRLAMSQDEDWPPLTLLRLPGNKNIY